MILDAPPGTACPVGTSLRGSDYVVLVTEPTPVRTERLELAVEVVRESGAAVRHRDQSRRYRTTIVCGPIVEGKDFALLAEIPNNRRIAEAYSRGEAVIEALPEYRPLFEDFFFKIAARARA